METIFTLGLRNLAGSWTTRGLGFLKDKYNVDKAFYFICFIEGNKDLYKYLERCGYLLIYKQAIKDGKGSFKGNCDAELVLHAMIEYQNYDQAVVVTSDGDFTCLLSHLKKSNKLKTVLAPEKEKMLYTC